MSDMKFNTALKFLITGQKIRRSLWPKWRCVDICFESKRLLNQQGFGWVPNINDLTSEDWEVKTSDVR